MERDIWLIIVGAGIALISNIVMRLLEFLIRLLAAKLYFIHDQRRYEKRMRQKIMGIEPEKDERDFWGELLTDIARLRGGGGEGPGLFDRPVDIVFFVFQWVITIGVFILWFFTGDRFM